MQISIEEPQLLQAESGSSVFYNNKALYSKYSPARNILNQISRQNFLSNTLVILASPVLDYGVKEILTKLDESSFLLAIQPDEVLYNFSQRNISEKNFTFLKSVSHNFSFLRIGDIKKFFSIFIKLDTVFDFKRLTIINSSVLSLSDTSQKTFFENIKSKVENHIKEKLVNRLTLIQMGHGIAANFFKNLKDAANPQAKFKTVDSIAINKPILILGAGESLDANFENIARHSEKFFIIALDAVAEKISAKVKIDAVALLESQAFISNAFVGSFNKSKTAPILFADLSSFPSIPKNWRSRGGEVFYYFTEYANANFLNRFKNLKLFSTSFESVSSVGLSAIQLALHLRKNSHQPIFVAGLDFAYKKNFTHSKYAFQVAKRFATTKKNFPLFSGNAFFEYDIIKQNINSCEVFSNQALFSYGRIFEYFLQTEKNIHSLESFARKNSFPFEYSLSFIKNVNHPSTESHNLPQHFAKNAKASIQSFLDETVSDLFCLRECLTGKTQLDKTTLKALILKNDFLFLHFPDYSPNLNNKVLETNFLKRVKIEIEYFYKFLKD